MHEKGRYNELEFSFYPPGGRVFCSFYLGLFIPVFIPALVYIVL